jgi:hypothetical protein
MGFKVTVAYYSTSRGVTQQTKGVSAIHYGKAKVWNRFQMNPRLSVMRLWTWKREIRG